MKTKQLLIASALLLTTTFSVQAQEVKAIINGVEQTFKVSQLNNNGLNKATAITVTGTWEAADVVTLWASLAVRGNQESLKTADFSKAVLNSCNALFRNCTVLTTITLPETENTNPVSFATAFSGCLALTTVNNLDKFTNITELGNTFLNCKSLTSITFASGENNTSVDCTSTFENCSSLTAINNFDKFTNTTLSLSFDNCTLLTELKLGSVSTVYPSFSGITKEQGLKVYLPATATEIPAFWTDYIGTIEFILDPSVNISNTEANAIPAISYVYSIDGRLVKTVLAEDYNTLTNGLQQGIYIVNGKKVAVK